MGESAAAVAPLAPWLCWRASSVLILSHALMIFDGVFIVLESINVLAMVVIITLAKRHEGGTCASHRAHGHDQVLA